MQNEIYAKDLDVECTVQLLGGALIAFEARVVEGEGEGEGVRQGQMERASVDASLVGVEDGVVDGGGHVLDVGLREAAHVDAPARHGVHVVVLADEVHLTGCTADTTLRA